MKVYAWKQFSSNHSASFTMVGIFDSDEKARAVADEFRALLREIKSFYGDPNFWPEYVRTVTDEDCAPPTPPEVAASRRYGVEWPRAIDWLDESQDAGQAVGDFDGMVILEPLKAEAWQGPRPFDALVTQFGGTVHLETESCSGYTDSVLLVSVSCMAPHAEAAEWIEFVLRDNIANGRNSCVEVTLLANAPAGCDEAIRYSRIIRDGNAILLADAHFCEGPAWGLAEVVGFLRSERCAGIRYAFRAVTPAI